MGERKRLSANRRKDEQKNIAFAKLLNIPTSPRKMRLVADMIRGKEVFRALGMLKFSNKEAAARLEKLVRSAVPNAQAPPHSPPRPWIPHSQTRKPRYRNCRHYQQQ